MKNALLFAAAVSAVAVAGEASALDVSMARRLEVDVGNSGIGVSSALAELRFTALGQDGEFCDYLVDVANAFNPNDVVLCTFRELRTPFAPSCIVNETQDFVTIVEAGGSAPSGATACAGYTLKGEFSADVTLILSECGEGLAGIQVIQTPCTPTIYPVRISAAGECGAGREGGEGECGKGGEGGAGGAGGESACGGPPQSCAPEGERGPSGQYPWGRLSQGGPSGEYPAGAP